MIAFPARVDEAADADFVAGLELLHVGADVGDDADDLVAGDDRVYRVSPLVFDAVEIGVADAAVEHLELDVAVGGGAASELEGREKAGGVTGGPADCIHGFRHCRMVVA